MRASNDRRRILAGMALCAVLLLGPPVAAAPIVANPAPL